MSVGLLIPALSTCWSILGDFVVSSLLELLLIQALLILLGLNELQHGAVRSWCFISSVPFGMWLLTA
jgi:hypothetical protein